MADIWSPDCRGGFTGAGATLFQQHRYDQHLDVAKDNFTVQVNPNVANPAWISDPN